MPHRVIVAFPTYPTVFHTMLVPIPRLLYPLPFAAKTEPPVRSLLGHQAPLEKVSFLTQAFLSVGGITPVSEPFIQPFRHIPLVLRIYPHLDEKRIKIHVL